jgi:hypothetical protein
MVEQEISKYCHLRLSFADSPVHKKGLHDNILKLIDGGSPSNRIDVVFMGDGFVFKAINKI